MRVTIATGSFMQSRRFALSVIGITVPALALGVGLSVPSPAAFAQSQDPVTETPLPPGPPAATGSAQPASGQPASGQSTAGQPANLVPDPAPATAPAGSTAAVPAEAQTQAQTQAQAATPGAANGQQNTEDTYDQESVLAAASGAFGKGAEEVGKVIEKIFADHGRPNGYIVGTEGGGAFIVGLRYGNGTLYHKVEGEQPIHWTGPSLGPDVGGDVSRTFTLIYHLYDTNDLYKRFPSVEGKVYLIGGFTVSYHQRDNVIVVPVRLGAGWRLGANLGYINFTKKRHYLPF